MERRRFLKTVGLAAAAGSDRVVSAEPAASEGSGTTTPVVRMHVGCQRGPTSPKLLQEFKRHGVEHICGYPVASNPNGEWTAEDLSRLRDQCDHHGVRLEMVALPFLTSSHIDREKRGAIMLGESPERDRDIEAICRMIEASPKRASRRSNTT